MDPSATVNHTTTKHLLISAPGASHLPPISRRSAARSVPGRRGRGVAASISRTTVAATVCVGVIRCAGPTATALNCIDTISDCVSGKQNAGCRYTAIGNSRTTYDSRLAVQFLAQRKQSNDDLFSHFISSQTRPKCWLRRSKPRPKFWPPTPIGPRGLKISDV